MKNAIFLFLIILVMSVEVSANPLTSALGYKHRVSSSNASTLLTIDSDEKLSRLLAARVKLNKPAINPEEMAKIIVEDIGNWDAVWPEISADELVAKINREGTRQTLLTFSGYIDSEIQKASNAAPCFEAWRFVCVSNIFSYGERLEGFGGASLGFNNDSGSIKLKAWQMDLGLSDNWKIPFNIYMAEVSSSQDHVSANSQKLLDLEQGKLNFMFSGVVKFRIFEFCNFPFGAYGCFAGWQAGARYTQLQSVTTDASDEYKTEDVMGSYAKLGLNILLPLFNRKESSIAGTLAVSAGYSYYYQNIKDSTILFPDARDNEGNPLVFDKDYQAAHYGLELNITDQLAVNVKHYEPAGRTGMDATTLLEISFSAKIPE